MVNKAWYKSLRREAKSEKLLTPKKIDIRSASWTFKILLFFIVAVAFNLVVLSVGEIWAILFRIELGLLNFVFGVVAVPRWILISTGLLIAVAGDLFFPVVYVPWMKKQKIFFYVPWRVKEEEDLIYLRLWTGKTLVTNRGWVSRRGARYIIRHRVTMVKRGKSRLFDDDLRTIDASMSFLRTIEILAEELAEKDKMLKNRETRLTIEEIRQINKAGGSKE